MSELAERTISSRGIDAMCVTPFDEHGRLDEAALAAVVDWLAGSGVGIYLGSYGTGEGHLLRDHEIERLYAVGVEAAGGRAPVYAAALGFAATDTVIEQAQAALALGVHAVQIHPPRPGPTAIVPRRNELERYYADVLDAVDGPIHLTNQVVMVGYAIPLDLLESLVQHPNVRRLNTSDPNLNAVSALVTRLAPLVDVRVGVISQLVTALSLGGGGALCFEADVAPAMCIEVVERFRAGDVDGLRVAFERLLRLNTVLSRFQNPRSVKVAMRALGLPAGALRRPYLELDDDEAAAVVAVLDELSLR